MMKKVCLYARVSTNDKGQDVNTQLMPLRNYVKQNNWQIINEYVDHISWWKQKRPGLDQLMKDAKEWKFEIVLVRRFDRMSRSTSHLIHTLDTFRELWINFVSQQERIDTSTATWQLMFTIISGFAQFERQIISTRVKAWIQKARSQWKQIGRKKEFKNYSLLLQLRKQGLSIRKIAKELNISSTLVHNILRVHKTS